MPKKRDYAALLLTYILWGFQPLYWGLFRAVDSYLILACRIVLAAVFSVLLLALTHRLPELGALLRDRQARKFLLPAVVFLFLDWAVFLVAVNAGHVIDTGLGYYINPLLLFAVGVLLFREPYTPMQLAALGIAAFGVLISAIAYGEVPVLALVIACNWTFYAALEKRVPASGVVSIAAETLCMTPFALAYLLLFRRADLAALNASQALLMLGSGIVTALPMYLYSSCVARFSLILMCFAQYLSPTFNLLCGILRGEEFSPGQLVSLLFFLAAILVSTVGEIRRAAKTP